MILNFSMKLKYKVVENEKGRYTSCITGGVERGRGLMYNPTARPVKPITVSRPFAERPTGD